MNALNTLFVTLVTVIILSYGFGLIVGRGKTDTANKIIAWELRQLSKIGRWVLGHVLQTIADIFGYLAKQCTPAKKKKP